ncbi:chromosome segregation and condensation protein ScpA [Thermodesulfatator indicus DSM 15286]|uniref:Segregation and condensation protein A n=1 Tax=Thermodesulfatator indicus (strain DSM 15286 / JCM 11887 / CIR29812) TaxID=667014 RepID=F8ADE6_THEID|nr:segregation/condensation protein A [Thermodesulfatator indicus]AEH45962.1 chromosome segregation and condensation protein ScpA [Thermodesulfatator indicus DSM 15286]
MPEECIVKVPVFEGPLDLLLHLVRKNKLDIFDLPISLITEQYLAYLEMMKALDLDIAGEYLLMAATLLYIKSQMLLPRPAEEHSEENALEDPRQEIVEPLLALAKYQKAAEILWERPILGRDIFVPPSQEVAPHDEVSVSLFELLSALKEALGRKPPTPLEVTRARYLIQEKMAEIEQVLTSYPRIRLKEFFEKATDREEAITIFLALLELAQRGAIILIQSEPLAEVEVIKR